MEPSYTKKYEISATLEGSDVFFMKIKKPKCHIPYHWHDGIEIIYNLSGCVWVLLKDKTIELEEGDVYLINSRLLHSIKSSPDNTGIILEFPYIFLKKYIPDIGSVVYDVNPHSPDKKVQTKLSQFKKIIYDMDVIIDVKPANYNLRFNSLVFEMLFQLQHNFKVTSPEYTVKEQAKNTERLSKIINYVHAHYTEPLSVAKMAGYVHLQPQYFCRFFKENMGETFLDFLNEVRLYYAYLDLLNTDLPVNQIITQNGFATYATFRKLFLAKFNCTPKELRKKHPEVKMEFLVTQ